MPTEIDWEHVETVTGRPIDQTERNQIHVETLKYATDGLVTQANHAEQCHQWRTDEITAAAEAGMTHDEYLDAQYAAAFPNDSDGDEL